MGFSSTNRMRMKKKEVQDFIIEFPKMLAKTQEIAQNLFLIIDAIGKNLVNLATYNIDPDILDKFDKQFKDYSVRKGELNRFFDDIARISSMLQDVDISGSDSGSSFNDSVIDDLQNVLTNINESIGSDISSKLEGLKTLKQDLETINIEVKQPVEQINESLQVFQKTVDVSFEIFTKSMLESLKNSVEMKSISEQVSEELYELEKQLPEKVKNTLTEEIRSVINDGMANQESKIHKILDEKLKDIQLTLNTDLSNLIDQKFNTLTEMMATTQVKASEHGSSPDTPLSRDMQEMNVFLKYLYSWPTNKDEILKRIEDFRDTLLVKRTNDPPFRVSATNVFRESISEISREERHISENKIRDIAQLFENLKRTIDNTEN